MRLRSPSLSFFPSCFLGIIILTVSTLVEAKAATSKIFQWQFTENLSTTLPACRSFPITVKPFDTNNKTLGSVAPYYAMAFAIGGTPKTSFIGDDIDNLVYTVDHPVGTKLLLTVVDANGSSGGVPPEFYTVVEGQTRSCIAPSTANFTDFTVAANISNGADVTTCQPWGITIKGGTPKPYTLSLLALNSPVVTNVTMGPNDDVFTYINRADPGTSLIAAISDLNGRWATGTPVVSTKGSANVDCIGLVSSSSTVEKIAEQAANAASALAAENRKRSALIAGVTVPLLLLVFGAAGAYWFFVYRKRGGFGRGKGKGDAEKQDLSINPFAGGQPAGTTDSLPGLPSEGGGQVLSIGSFLHSTPPSSPRSPKSPTVSTTTRSESTMSSRPTVGRDSRPGFTNFPRASVRRSKATEAGYPSISPPSRNNSASESSALGLITTAVSPSSGPGSSVESPGVEYVYQHRDGGGAPQVRELPPPYADPARIAVAS